AQLISQFINIQVDKKYADEINADLKTVKINEVVNAQRIGGTILFCGPYNLKELLKPKKNTMKLPFKKIGWAYFGTKNVNDKKLELSDIPDNLSDNYPPSFITDGNAFSFENQGKALAAALKRRGIYVKDVFYPKDEAVLKHEYQFNMDTPYAQKTFDALLDFLKVTAEAKTMPAAKLPSQETTTK
ncbi:MAG: hypothetical protein LBO62_02140, partial [Endomicrobium sp.]|nr:hypothetical protein [Endomicrobium sp.]